MVVTSHFPYIDVTCDRVRKFEIKDLSLFKESNPDLYSYVRRYMRTYVKFGLVFAEGDRSLSHASETSIPPSSLDD